jgi:alpha-glucosidase
LLQGSFPFLKSTVIEPILAGHTTLDQPPGPNTWPPTSTLASSLNLAPSISPNIVDPTARNAQKSCLGYKAADVATTDITVTADLTLAGPACNAYGNEISDLVLEVQYQNDAQINVKIYPKFVVPANRSM